MIRINLAPPETRRRRPGAGISLPSFNLGILFAIVYVAAIGGIGYYFMGLAAEEAKVTREVDKLTADLAVLKQKVGAGANVKGQLADVKRRVAVLDELTKGQGKPVAMLDAFIDTVPRDLWITALEQKESNVKLSGTAFSTTAVSDFLANLKSSGKFKDVDITISRQAIDKTPATVTFEVTCKFEI